MVTQIRASRFVFPGVLRPGALAVKFSATQKGIAHASVAGRHGANCVVTSWLRWREVRRRLARHTSRNLQFDGDSNVRNSHQDHVTQFDGELNPAMLSAFSLTDYYPGGAQQ